jgi:PilZ domain
MAAALAKPLYSRRMSSRIEPMGDVWVYWRCEGMDDVSRVCDLSVGGLFLSTPVPPPAGAKAKLDFLVQEGQIRAEAVVRHLVPSGGLGLKFTAITDKDCPNLVALLNRIRALSSAPRVPSFAAPSQLAPTSRLSGLKVENVHNDIGLAI